MNENKNEKLEAQDVREEALIVEVPTEIRAGVRVALESSCKGSSACYYIAAAPAALA